jgi:methylthioribose-1-phosphate isomerase
VEQRAGSEVTDLAPSPLGTQAYNPAFDVTPPELITAIVTEKGVISPVTAESLVAVCG